jgi:hypothetical protein
VSPRTGTAYKAKSLGKLAQRNKAPDSGDMVNAGIAQGKFTLLNFPKGTLFNRVNVLIRGDLFNMRS